MRAIEVERCLAILEVQAMLLELTQDEARQLRELLQDHLPELKREVARTDVRSLRHELAVRQELCERLVDRLGAPNAAQTG
jgi:hypothetical protein